MSSVERLRLYLEYKGVSHAQFYKTTNIANGYLNTVKEVGSKKLTVIKQYYPDLNLHWLVTGEGEMLDKPKEYNTSNPDLGRALESPIFFSRLDANDVTHAKKLIADGYIKIPDMPRSDGAIAIRGENMYPLLKSGDIVIFQKLTSLDDIKWGEMYVIHMLKGEYEQISVHYIHEGSSKDTIKLLSYNSRKYPAMEYPLTSILRIALVKATIYINSLT